MQPCRRALKNLSSAAYFSILLTKYGERRRHQDRQRWKSTPVEPESGEVVVCALEADRWFTTLMGDDVQGRKEYIEQFGQFVKNLDV